MPEPIQRGQRYMPGLDGLRAVAVVAVILYHLKFTWIPGGLLGVGVFFTLSGYLITDILLAPRRGNLLTTFWAARARRLLPALFLMLMVVLAWVTVIGPHQPPDFRTSALTAVFYVNNWWQIFHDVSYFQAFGAPAPLNHLWSLSIEEQFYIVWPLLTILGVRYLPEIRADLGVRVRLAGATLAMAVASAILMAILYHPSIDPSRVYYGTDTRAVELLVGAALAMVWPSRRLRSDVTLSARRVIDVLGTIGLVTVGLMFWRTTEFSPFLYRGGFLLLSVATALVLAALVHPASRLGPLLGSRGLRWIGERSYGIYLWHFPIIILTNPAGARDADLARATAQVAATVAVAALSWRYVEDPIRHGALSRLLADFQARRWRREQISRWGWIAIATTGAVFISAIAGAVGAGVGPSQSKAPGNVAVSRTVRVAGSVQGTRTACRAVVHIGDSTSEGLVSSDYLPDPSQLISAQYGRVGATTQHLEVSGARSIYERFEGLPNARDVAQAWRDRGFRGCWVLALGTNESANVAAGSKVGYDERIDSMMSTIGGQPVMWVNVKSLVPSGPYAAPNMKRWDAALLRVCARYPNMRVYDWARDVRDGWFIPDGIHFTSEGYAARGRLIANALLKSFPFGQPVGRARSSCLVQPKVDLPATNGPTMTTGASGPPTSGGATPPTGASAGAGVAR